MVQGPRCYHFTIYFQTHQAQDCKMYPVTCRGCGKEGIPRGEVAIFKFLFF